ncbi:MAG TPA: hypothetical protein VF875_02705 [Anaeromyxobacter sp.]
MFSIVVLAGSSSAAASTPKASSPAETKAGSVAMTTGANPWAAYAQRTQPDDGPKSVCWYYRNGQLVYYQC